MLGSAADVAAFTNWKQNAGQQNETASTGENAGKAESTKVTEAGTDNTTKGETSTQSQESNGKSTGDGSSSQTTDGTSTEQTARDEVTSPVVEDNAFIKALGLPSKPIEKITQLVVYRDLLKQLLTACNT